MQRGIDALRILRDRGRILDPAAARPADDVSVALRADGCTVCGVCVRACPQGAFELSDEGGVGVLRHRPEVCRGEQACVRLCPETALTVSANLLSLDLLDAALVELARVATISCARCGTRHPASDGPLCPPCTFRRANPFGSAPPPRHR